MSLISQPSSKKIKSSTQEDVFNYLKESPRGLIFVHGKAGCGKTHVIRKIESYIPDCLILTPTNLAASLYRQARTIHSYFYGILDNIENKYQDPNNLSKSTCEALLPRFCNIKLLIIDEISMVRADLLEMINQIFQKSFGNRLPFGGITTVLVGDMFQLPPIITDEAVLEYLKEEYGGIYFFNSHVIQKEIHNLKLFELNHSYRHENDPDFANLLDSFRFPMSAEEKISVLNSLNSRVTEVVPENAIYIATSNEEVRQVNSKKLSELPGENTIIDAEYSILDKSGSNHITFRHSEFPIKQDIMPIVIPTPYESQLQFKRGARVMFTKNSRRYGYLNGEFGTVIDFKGPIDVFNPKECYFVIEKEVTGERVLCPNPNDKYYVKQITDYRYDVVYDRLEHKLIRKTPFIQRTQQYPIKLAYAFTIHKAQGQTYDKVVVDLKSHVFAPGQLYVALSRAKSLQGLFLTKAITYSDIITDESIFDFLDTIRGNSQANRFSITNSHLPYKHLYYSNILCDDFMNFVKTKEDNASNRDYLLFVLGIYRSLMVMKEFEKALQEQLKIIGLITSTHGTEEDFDKLLKSIGNTVTESECQANLKSIFEIYQNLIKQRRKQYSYDNKVLTFKLV